MIRIIVIEDEASVQKDIVGLLKLVPDIKVIQVIDTVKEALQVLPTSQVDLVLLDIHLKDGTAFDLLSQLETVKFPIIFLTAYEQYAINAIKTGALDYLLKPLDLDELKLALSRLKRKTVSSISKNQDVESTKPRVDKIILRNTDGIHFISFDELMYCHGEGAYTSFYTCENSPIMVSKNLKEYERILPNSDFIRCHQSYMVNKRFIKKINKDDFLELKNGILIPISGRKKDDVVKEILKL